MKLGVGSFYDALLVQLGWWSCVLATAHGYFLLGPAVVLVLLVVQTWNLPALVRQHMWRGSLILGLAGTTIDSIQSWLGILTFEGTYLPGIAPLWITALWCHFATVVPAFSALRSRLILAGILGGLGGPLAYAGGVKWDAASFHQQPWLSVVVIGAVWATAFPLMIRCWVSPTHEGEMPEA